MTRKTRSKLILPAVFLVLSGTYLAQKRPERPKLHSEFYFGTYPVSRDFNTIMAKDNARLVVVGFHQGWDIEKIAKESKQTEEDLDRLFADLEEMRLVYEEDQYSRRPMLPVIRDKDIEKVQEDLTRDSADFTKVVQQYWPEIETFASSLAGAKGVTRSELLYQIAVGSILFGGMQDAFFEDQTLMVSPPRRTGSQRYYAWLVEGDQSLAGSLKREQWETEGYSVVSIGTGTSQARVGLAQLRSSNAMMLDEAEARRYRSFVTVFSKDRLLPFFKRNRSDFLKTLNLLDAGRYVRVSDAFAWYYDQIANAAVESLVAEKRIQAPAAQYAFALKAPGR